ncbi:hypothetical protein SAMN04489859_103638 [Paracoccus alcaliphilus]|uniref:Uncharacterized protein n=1 Tax=Paracoccus alcaliphilus TaxID=34002 RepID=A0A1H8M601_9RHOB|nr:hypothetical protein [Paracoccus alcaliphilus]WCR18384.1 hypothetical protein JHW40_01010 [Paracoccus alcaliphilus]SEO12700.1 hypothetical protein SAMN04489859_103638 [Paracoccus alcaliphilus]
MAEQPRLFLERASLRRRRLGDAARVLPVAAALAVLIPVWWLPWVFASAGGVIWLFVTWAGLIVLIGLLHRALIRAEAAIHNADPSASASQEGSDAL